MHTGGDVEPTLLDRRKALANISVKTNAARTNDLFTPENTFMAPPEFVVLLKRLHNISMREVVSIARFFASRREGGFAKFYL